MKYLIILLCGFLSCTKVTVQGRLARKSIKNSNDSIMANCLIFALISLVFSVSLRGGINTNVIFYSILFGITSALFQIFYALSLKTGPFSITCLLINLSMIVPTIFSIIFFGEKLTIIKFIGMALCIFALALNTKSDNKKMNLKWFLYVILAFFSTGSLAIVQKAYAKSPFAGDLLQFLFLGYLSAFLITFVVVVTQKAKKRDIYFKVNKENLGLVVIIVACLGIYQCLYTFANSFIDVIVLNPSVSGLSTVFLSLSGMIVFKEHFTPRQIWSICIGFVAIVLISL